MLRTYPCPTCWNEVGFRQLSCAHCDRSLLCGLISEPVEDLRSREKGARVLSRAPGGPTEPEARRRLSQGLPLVVGLTRETTEQIQDELIGAGVVARIGPAPAGTRPLEAGSDTSGVGVRLLIALAIPLLTVAVWVTLDPGAEKKATTLAPAAATPEPAELGVTAAIEPHGFASYNMVGLVRALSPVASTAKLELQLLDGPDGSLLHGRVVAVSRTSAERGIVSFRESLHEAGFSGGESVWLIGVWGELRSNPQLLHVPSRSPR